MLNSMCVFCELLAVLQHFQDLSLIYECVNLGQASISQRAT